MLLRKFINFFKLDSAGVNLAKISRPILVILVVTALQLTQLSFSALPAGTGELVGAPLVSARSPVLEPSSTAAPILDQDVGETLSAETPAKNDKQIEIAKPPVYFIPNQVQMDESVEYYASGVNYNFYLTPEGVTYAFTRQKEVAGEDVDPVGGSLLGAGEQEKAIEGYALKIAFAGANPAVEMEGRCQKSATVNYFAGSNESNWQTDIPTFGQVAYKELYPGIDLTYQGNDGMLKYEFVVAPGADPARIKMVYQGVDFLEVDQDGNLIITTPWGTLKDEKPFVYQLIGNRQIEVKSSYTINRGTVTFTLGNYNRNISLAIDPGLIYATFLGGSRGDYGESIAVDASGCVYVAGITMSPDFPTTSGAYNTSYSEHGDAFVTKLDPSGNTLLYSTFLGGVDHPDGVSMAVDADGCAHITGQAGSDFPTTVGAYDTSCNGNNDAIVVKLNPKGNRLLYSTFLGGSLHDRGRSISIGDDGCAYVTGYTESFDFPTTSGAFDTSYNESGDVFVAKLDPTGSSLLYSTFTGGNNHDIAECISVDAIGCVYVTGRTASPDFPTTPEAYDTSHNGPCGAFVTKLNPSGSTQIYSTFLGGCLL